MDRVFVYPGAIPQDLDVLNAERNTMVALGLALQAIIGTTTAVDGLSCGVTSPASLAVLVGPGTIYSLQNVDSTPYGSLPADTADQIVKQGIVLGNTTLATPAPGTAGFSINYLIQAAYQVSDVNNIVLPYYNASNPAQPFAGPGNNGQAQATKRAGQCILSAKAGVAAATGTQTTPAPDAGYVGLFVVTVANGQATVAAGNISQLASAPFINPKLGQLAAAIQAQAGNYVLDTSGVANQITVAPTPVLAAYVAGLSLRIKAANANTGPVTVNVSGLGNVSLLKPSQSGLVALSGGEIQAGQVFSVVHDGTNLQLASPSANTVAAHGQCRLTLSGGNLLLSPFGGNGLAIAGKLQQIPSAGVSLAPTGLTASTLYYIYAWMNAGVMTLEASTTTHATDTTAGNVGVEIKSGDNSRSLVGMAYVTAGPAFADTAAQRFVASWFNRRPRVSRIDHGTNATSSTTPAVMSSAKAEFLVWANAADILVRLSGSSLSTTANGSNFCSTHWQAYLDGVAMTAEQGYNTVTGTTTLMNPGMSAYASPAEGYHYAQGYHWVDASQAITSSAEVQASAFM